MYQGMPVLLITAHQSSDRNINSCQFTRNVRQARRSWYRFLDTSFMLDPFSLSWLSMLFSHVVLGLPRGLVPFTLEFTTSWSIGLLMTCPNHLNLPSLMTSSIDSMWNSSYMSAFRILFLLVSLLRCLSYINYVIHDDTRTSMYNFRKIGIFLPLSYWPVTSAT